MPGVIRPPWGAPTGPELSDAEVVRTFAQGARTGHSGWFHIEDRTLLAERFITVAIRCEPSTLLIRIDLETGGLTGHLRSAGLFLQVQDPDLATVIGLQVSGHPAAAWDLWGIDRESALSHMRTAASDPPVSILGGDS